jgi:hypothetical protein
MDQARGVEVNGLCMVIIQALKVPGDIRLEASSPGLEPATLGIASLKTVLRPEAA